MPYGDHMSWMWIGWVLGLVVLLLLTRTLVVPVGGRGSESDSPEAILKRRYARGEIARDEYLRQLEELRR